MYKHDTDNEHSDRNPDLLIDFENVSFIRSGKALLESVTWQVELDERWVILGPNGAGKTTLIRLAAAEEFPSAGRAWLMGERIGKTDMRDLRTMIGLSSAAVASRIAPEEKVTDLVISAGYAILGRWREEYSEPDFAQTLQVLERVGALHLVDRNWGTLSEGERKRVLVARALMTNPELLLLDEPASGMDLGGREDLVGYLSELALDPDAPAMVMITHHVEEIPDGFTHALLLDEGTVVAQGLIDDVLTDENLSRAFHQQMRIDKIDGRYFARRARQGGSHRAV
ncbi:ABC transporter ATP-binding protein [Corynebacterium sp. sy017]|uniref:ABC transporter ATP-binding protein n=1 Tax=unclassified Corynebacterium TaxID=2624378 RepID=UPI00118602E5|nr:MULTISPECIES: ABC transporter ATP-binding protein [unclassified Corynebacterium]MBP3089027.1 ABC transporter ATP-binding protein [Corynebacterium sp. sy017]QDZ43515.1 ABC transporter ATP-binding protein [Corynebacterium sp. sy039]TSD91527.1 ABC transporter ATP-binding protein [Corynebacterium sp. SY003]